MNFYDQSNATLGSSLDALKNCRTPLETQVGISLKLITELGVPIVLSKEKIPRDSGIFDVK